MYKSLFYLNPLKQLISLPLIIFSLLLCSCNSGVSSNNSLTPSAIVKTSQFSKLIPIPGSLSITLLNSNYSPIIGESIIAGESFIARVILANSRGIGNVKVSLTSSNLNTVSLDNNNCILSSSKNVCDVIVHTMSTALDNEKIYITALAANNAYPTIQTGKFNLNIILATPEEINEMQLAHSNICWAPHSLNSTVKYLAWQVSEDAYNKISYYDVTAQSLYFNNKIIRRVKSPRKADGTVTINFEEYTGSAISGDTKKIQV